MCFSFFAIPKTFACRLGLMSNHPSRLKRGLLVGKSGSCKSEEGDDMTKPIFTIINYPTLWG